MIKIIFSICFSVIFISSQVASACGISPRELTYKGKQYVPGANIIVTRGRLKLPFKYLVPSKFDASPTTVIVKVTHNFDEESGYKSEDVFLNSNRFIAECGQRIVQRGAKDKKLDIESYYRYHRHLVAELSNDKQQVLDAFHKLTKTCVRSDKGAQNRLKYLFSNEELIDDFIVRLIENGKFAALKFLNSIGAGGAVAAPSAYTGAKRLEVFNYSFKMDEGQRACVNFDLPLGAVSESVVTTKIQIVDFDDPAFGISVDNPYPSWNVVYN